MALSYQSAGVGNAASGASPMVVQTTVALNVGDCLFIAMAYDNSGGGGGDPMSGTFTPTPATGALAFATGSGQTALNDPGAASAGLAARTNTYNVTTAIPSGTNISIAWSGTIVVRAVAMIRVSSSVATVLFRSVTFATGNNWAATTAPGQATPSAVNAGDLVLCWAAYQNGSNITGDADTTNGSWSAIVNSFSGSGATGMAMGVQGKVPNATGVQNFNPTGPVSNVWSLGAAIFGENITTPVSASRATTWAVRAPVTATRSTTWSTLVRLGIDTVLDSYPSSNFSSNFGFGTTTVVIGQSFFGNDGALTRAGFYLINQLGATGTIRATLYASSGSHGSTAVGTGTALATSTTIIDVATIPNASGWYYFDFAPYQLTPVTTYIIAVEGTLTNLLSAGSDTTSPTHGGNQSRRSNTGVWTAYNTVDTCFEVYTGSEKINRSTTWNVLYTAPKVETFTYDFLNTGPPLTDAWTLIGTPSKSQSRLQMDVIDTYEGVTSKAILDMQDSSLFAQLWPPSNATAAPSREAYLGVVTTTGNNALFVGVAGALGNRSMVCRITTAGVNDDYYLPDYDPFDHQYMRIRVSGTTVYYDFSETGFTWTNIPAATRTFSFDVSSVQVQLKAGQWQTETAPASYAFIDNVNLTAAYADISTINTDFTSATTWYHAVDVAATPNRFEFPAVWTYLYAETLTNGWSLKDSRVWWHVAQVAGVAAEADFYAGCGAFGSNIWMGVDSSGWVGGPVGVNILYLSVREENTDNTVKWTGAWDPAKPVLSIRNTSGVWYYERSATGDPGTWETLWSGTLRVPEVRCYLGWYQDIYGAQPAPGAGRIESLNQTIEAPTATVPDPPISLQATPVAGGTSMDLAWAAGYDGGSALLDYIVEYRLVEAAAAVSPVLVSANYGPQMQNTAFTIVKPPGLAVGETLLFISGTEDTPTEPLWTFPTSGWVKATGFPIHDTFNPHMWIQCYWKVADASDVALSDFTCFLNLNGYSYPHLSRITDHNGLSPVILTSWRRGDANTPKLVGGTTTETGLLVIGYGTSWESGPMQGSSDAYWTALLGTPSQGNVGFYQQQPTPGAFPDKDFGDTVLDNAGASVVMALRGNSAYSDNFNRADGALGEHWSAPNWGIISNGAGKTVGGNDFAVFLKNINTTDMWAECTVIRDDNFTCLDVRMQGAGDGGAGGTSYLGFWDPAGWFALGKNLGGSWGGQFATTTGVPHPTLPYKMRLEAEGSTVRLLVNDVEVLSATDTSITTGKYAGANVGFSGVAAIDNYRCGPLPYVAGP